MYPSINKWALMFQNTLLSKVYDKLSVQKSRAADASVKKHGLTCPRGTGHHWVRDSTQRHCSNVPRPDKPFSRGKISFCFKRFVDFFSRDCPMRPTVSAASSGKAVFPQEHRTLRGGKHGRVKPFMSLSRKDLVAFGNPLSPGDLKPVSTGTFKYSKE